MKIRILFLLCILLAVGTFAGVQAAVFDSADEVQYTETTLAGDLSHVADLRAHLRLQLRNRLFWDITLSPTDPQHPDVSCRLLYKDPVYYGRRPRDTFECWTNFAGNFTSSSSGDLLDPADVGPGDHLFGMRDLVQIVADRTPAGESRTQTLRLCEYYTYYPLGIAMDMWHEEGVLYRTNTLDGYGPIEPTENGQRLTERLNELFRIPVPPDVQVRITVYKDALGNTYEVESQMLLSPLSLSEEADAPVPSVPEEGTAQAEADAINYYMELSAAPTVVTEQAVYIIPQFYSEQICLPDAPAPELEQGFGIYRIPYVWEDTAENSYDPWTVQMDTEHIEQVFPLDDPVYHFWTDESGDLLYLVTVRDRSYTLHLLDAVSLEEKQVLPFVTLGTSSSPEAPSTDLSQVYADASFIVYYLYTPSENKPQLLLLTCGDDGVWRVAFQVPMAQHDAIRSGIDDGLSPWSCAYTYDGERLLLAQYASHYRSENPVENPLCALYLQAYSPEGLLYAGVFHASLDIGTQISSDARVTPGWEYPDPDILLP